MNEPLWTDVITAIGAAITPLIVVGAGLVIARRQSRNDELLKVRIDYYQKLIPDLNRLMCYITFIGAWRDISPLEIIQLKRRLDVEFYCAAPLFSAEVPVAYEALMSLSFKTFGGWGEDAKILTSSFRRRQAWSREDEPWSAGWDALFAIEAGEPISASNLGAYRRAYDDLIARLVGDLSISRTRTDYTTTRVSLNASAPQPRGID
ncbi:MAG: hypothetical protein JWO01_2187 [Microbacteriaceae bacterium]|nr:hypothetical protein [Microbacteriaceae bacterium]